ncbi:MAG: TonB-dependent receptor [Gammaproteobacteria bacterium]|nr:MAG: TonB-dependent receptor [Gammaproteobacteria bacterium]
MVSMAAGFATTWRLTMSPPSNTVLVNMSWPPSSAKRRIIPQKPDRIRPISAATPCRIPRTTRDCYPCARKSCPVYRHGALMSLRPALALLVLSAPVFAAHMPPAPLEVVVVSASRTETALSDTPASLGKLDTAQIRQQEATFTGEVLNKVPGVFMTDLGNEQHSMSIRLPVSTNAYYLYMEDGLPIRPLGLFNHNSLYEVNLDGSGSIEVIKGPASSLYGSNAVGGTVNLLTEAPRFGNGGMIGVSGSEEGYVRSDFSADAGNERFGVRATGYVSQRDGGWQDHNDADKQAFTLRADYRMDDTTTWTNLLSYNKLQTDMPGSLGETDYRYRPGYSYHTFTWRDVDATRAYSRLQGEWNDGGKTSITVFARQNSTAQLPSYLIFNTSPGNAVGRINDNDFLSGGFDVNHAQSFDWADSRLITGVYYDLTDNEYTEDNLAIVRDMATLKYIGYQQTSPRRDFDVTLENQAFYTQFELSPFTNARLVLGGRYDTMTYDYHNALTPGPTSGAPSETRDFEKATFRLGFIYNIGEATSLYSNLSEGFTPPEVSSLYGRLDVPNLKEATYTNLDIGIRQRLWDNRINLDASLYRLEGDDEIVNFTVMPGLSLPQNAGSTVHEGVELGVDIYFSDEWSASLSAAHSTHEYDEYRVSPTLDYSGKDMPNAPETIANTELAYTPHWFDGSRFAIEWVHIDKYWMDNANAVRYDGHDLINLRASYTVQGWTVWTKLMNATDEHYAEVASSSYNGVTAYDPDRQNTYTPGAPRTLFIGFRYAFGE